MDWSITEHSDSHSEGSSDSQWSTGLGLPASSLLSLSLSALVTLDTSDSEPGERLEEEIEPRAEEL